MMLHWLPSVPYPPSQDGYWSPISSTLNWCEEDYYATIYSAEIINSITNLLFLYLAGKGFVNCFKNDHPTIFFVSFSFYALIGVGSFLFHNTLKYPMQLIDELSMIYTTCIMWHASFSYGKSRLYSVLLAVALLNLALFFTGYYHYIKDPTFHQNAYAILTIIVLLRSMYMMEFQLRPSLRPKMNANVGKFTMKESERNGSIAGETNGSYPARSDKGSFIEVSIARTRRESNRDQRILRDMWIMILYGLVMFLGGFTIWSMDTKYCSTLRSWRREIGLPWGIFLEGHGWWHLMTGLGGYVLIVWSIWLRHCLDNRQEEFELYWPSFIGTVPSIVRKTSAGTPSGTVSNISLKQQWEKEKKAR